MCGRYNLYATTAELEEYFEVLRPPAAAPRYNIAPTQSSLILREEEAAPAWATARWGLVPSWAKDLKSGARMINARSETVAEKPAFRAAYKRRRCIVPAGGYYEWKKLDAKSKQPYHIHRDDGKPLAFAGLWERWTKGDEPVESFSVLTTESEGPLGEIHDRMPVMLSRDSHDVWLDPEVDPAKLLELIRPLETDRLVGEAVSPIVGNVRNDTPECIEPIDLQERLF